MEEYEGLKPTLKRLRNDLGKARNRKAKADAEVASLEKAIAGIEGLTGPEALPEALTQPVSPPATSQNGSHGTPAIRALMAEKPGPWKARALFDELSRRGQISPDAKYPLRGIEAAINRMWRKGELERVGPGLYRLQPRSEEP